MKAGDGESFEDKLADAGGCGVTERLKRI
jgi:hypothetical protein